MNLADVAYAERVEGRKVSSELRRMITQLKIESDAAWEAAVQARLRGDERTDAAESARARTLCDVLGDQERLTRMDLL